MVPVKIMVLWGFDVVSMSILWAMGGKKWIKYVVNHQPEMSATLE